MPPTSIRSGISGKRPQNLKRPSRDPKTQNNFLGSTLWNPFKQAAGKGIRSGVEKRAEKIISGGGEANQSKGSGTSKDSHIGNAVFFIGILMVGFFIWGVIVAPGLESGFWQSQFGGHLKQTFEVTRNIFGFFIEQMSKTSRILRGEEFIGLERGGSEIKEKTGISFGEFKVWPTSQAYVGEDFGLDGILIVGKLDVDKLEKVKFECSLDNIKGIVEVFDEEKEENIIFDVYNPGGKYSETLIDAHCRFKGDNQELILSTATGAKILTKAVNLALTYTLPVESKLKVFGVPADVYKEYRARNDAFDELENGIYENYNSKIISKMKYVSDVELSVWFDKQPLGVGQVPTLRLGFKNKNPKNDVKINKLVIELPRGLSFDAEECEILDITGNLGALKGSYMKEIQNELNYDEGGGESTVLRCKIKVDEEILGNSNSEIVPAGDITADLNYNYKIIKEQAISLRKKDTQSSNTVSDEAKIETKSLES